MASESWRADPPLSARLAAEPHRFGFFQAARLLHALARDRGHVGLDGPPGREAVRFAAEQSLGFPASEVLSLADGDGGPPRMCVRFMGLTGPVGALPRHYTEMIADRVSRSPDDPLAAFLDLLNHRLVSLFFRSWEKYRPALRLDRSGQQDLDGWCFALLGLATRGLRRRLAVDDRSLLFYTGLLAQRPRSALGLECLLGDYFGGLPVAVEQFCGQWLRLPEDSLTRLERFGTNNVLGTDAVLGSRIWHTQSRFRVRFGPLDYADFSRLLPCGDRSRVALELVRFFAGTDLDVEFQLVLRAGDVPPCRLDTRETSGVRLGWSSWLPAHRPRRDTTDPVLDSGKILSYHARQEVRLS